MPDVTDNLCGEETCTPGPVGYICGKRRSGVCVHVFLETREALLGIRARRCCANPAVARVRAAYLNLG